MRVLVACEFSGVVRDAFVKRGHNAWSCDLLPSERPIGKHLQCDVLSVLSEPWDLMIAHPPCTYLCSSGIHWNKRRPERATATDRALEFFMALANAPIERIAVENPIGIVSTHWRKPDQIIQPWMFGHKESKSTCLWLKNLPLLESTNIVGNPAWIPCPDGCTEYYCTIHRKYVHDCKCPPADQWAQRGLDPYINGGRLDNQTPSGQNKLGPSDTRWMERSRTYQGIADAMAEQWGCKR